MLIDKLYLRFLKIFLIIFVVTMPLANRDIFSLVFSRVFPVRVALVLMIAVSSLYLLGQFLASQSKKIWLKEKLNFLKGDFIFKLLFLLLVVRVVSLKNSLNLSASLILLLFFLSVIAIYLIFKFLLAKETGFLQFLFKVHLGVVSLVVLYGLSQLI